jgi:hypothetical protein
MPYPNTKKKDDLVNSNSKSKPLRSINIWTDNIDNEINDPCFTNLVTNIINLKHYDL